MSSRLGASLYFGYNLGGEEDGWTFALYDENEVQYIWPDWMETDEDGYAWDPVTEIENRLTELLGPGHGIKSDMYGTESWSGWVLGFEILSGDAPSTAVDTGRLNRSFPEMRDRLHDAAEALGLTFTDQPEPKLFLTASYF